MNGVVVTLDTLAYYNKQLENRLGILEGKINKLDKEVDSLRQTLYYNDAHASADIEISMYKIEEIEKVLGELKDSKSSFYYPFGGGIND